MDSHLVVTCACELVLVPYELGYGLLLFLSRHESTARPFTYLCFEHFLGSRGSIVAACHVTWCCVLDIDLVLEHLSLVASRSPVLRLRAQVGFVTL